MDSINIFERIAWYNGYKSWDLFIKAAKKRSKEFKIPLFLDPKHSIILFTEIKDKQGMRLSYQESTDKVYLQKQKEV